MRFSVQPLLTESKLHEVLYFEAVICVQSRRGRFWSGRVKCSQLNPITWDALCNQHTCALIKLRGWKERKWLSESNRKDVNKITAENMEQKNLVDPQKTEMVNPLLKAGRGGGAIQKWTYNFALKTSWSWQGKYLGHWMWRIKNYPIGTNMYSEDWWDLLNFSLSQMHMLHSFT